MPRGTSEDALCFGLDPRPKHWMQARACHHIALPAQDGAHALLNVDQFDKGLKRGLSVSKKRSTSLSGRA